jgi:AraC-like DNA-binding protein
MPRNLPPQDLQDVPRPVSALGNDYADGHVIPWHRHQRAQLVYASTGVITAQTADGTWVVPPHRAVWVPAGTDHRHRCHGRVEMRSIFIDAAAQPDMGEYCAVLAVPPLLRELILHIVDIPLLYDRDGPDGRTVAVLLDQIERLDTTPLHLPSPGDPRARKVADALIADPADARPLKDWARVSGASERTLARLFRRDTGMSFGLWRQQARLLAAMPLLARGRSVAETADELGYATASAFIAMFRRSLGTSPGAYYPKPSTAVQDTGEEQP